MKNIPVTEDELKAKAVGQRVTPADVEGAIASASYFRAGQAADNAARLGQGVIVELDQFNALQCLTFCVLVLQNGYTVTGQSACADPNNYIQEIGERLAREDAVKKIWPLLGYALRDELAQDQAMLDGRLITEKDGFGVYAGTKVVHAIPMSRAVYNDFRKWTMPEDEQDDEGYLVEYTNGGAPNVEGYAGYISWSPKDVFERSYRALGQGASASEPTPGPAGEGARDPKKEEKEDWFCRLLDEHQVHHDRVIKLELFIGSDAFHDLELEDRHLLTEQYGHMIGYHHALSARVMRENRKREDATRH